MCSLLQPIRLNLGAGAVRRPDGYINVDMNPRTAPDVLAKLPALPFKADSIDAIYTSHFLEHLTDEDAIEMMSEMYRVLKLGAAAYCVVPYALSHAHIQDPTHKSGWVPEKFLYFTPHFFVLHNSFEQRFQLRNWSQTKEEVTAVLVKAAGGEACTCPVCAGTGPPETRKSRWSKVVVDGLDG